MRDDDWNEWSRIRFERSEPREAQGGIKPRRRRGSFAESWWGRRWIEVLDRFQIQGRLARGRSYTRKGQVTSLEISKGAVNSKVQGSRPSPYLVTIKFKQLGEDQWQSIVTALNREAYFGARLLAGELPQEMEELFRRNGFHLFPGDQRDLKTECSCPDWSNPCKHVAAVYYLLAEEFDRDPFLILKLRGRTREEIVESLTASTGMEEAEEPGGRKLAEGVTTVSVPETLRADPARFWTGSDPEELAGSSVSIPDKPALLRRLGGFPFWQGRTTMQEELESVYGGAADRWILHFEEKLAQERS